MVYETGTDLQVVPLGRVKVLMEWEPAGLPQHGGEEIKAEQTFVARG